MFAGAFIALMFSLLFYIPALALFGRWGGFLSLFNVFSVVVFAGIAKEYLDSLDREHHKVEFWDFLATVIGGLFVLIPIVAGLIWWPLSLSSRAL